MDNCVWSAANRHIRKTNVSCPGIVMHNKTRVVDERLSNKNKPSVILLI